MSADGLGVSDVAARYASALYDLADEKSAIDAVAGDLSTLQKMIDDSDDFRRFIKSPVLSRNDQSKGIAAIADKAQLSPLTLKFLGLIAGNRRRFALPGMIIGFRGILAERRGQATAQVTSAAPLGRAWVRLRGCAAGGSGGCSGRGVGVVPGQPLSMAMRKIDRYVIE